jgi:N utilization substance protein B
VNAEVGPPRVRRKRTRHRPPPKVDERREAREAALQMLYALELTGQTPAEIERWYLGSNPLTPAVRDHAARLLEGATLNREHIEAVITAHAHDWRWERISPIERCVLKLAAAEMLIERRMPLAVVINEAMQLIRKFSQPAALSFINGVLNAVAEDLRPQAKAE